MADRYPPPHHLLSDLGFEVDSRDGGLQVRMPVADPLLDAAGSIRAGILGLALDVMAGGLSVEATRPDWALTSDLSVHALRPCAAGTLVIRGEALRAGRTQLVVEGGIHEAGAPDQALAHGHIGFTRVPRREDTPPPPPPNTPGGVYTFGDGAKALTAPLLDALAVRTVDAGEGVLEIPLTPYVRNSVGGLQGGVVTTLIDAAACVAARSQLGAAAHATDVTTRYLALGRGGPLRTRARPLRGDAEEALFRVELRDLGQDDRLVSVGTARVRG